MEYACFSLKTRQNGRADSETFREKKVITHNIADDGEETGMVSAQDFRRWASQSNANVVIVYNIQLLGIRFGDDAVVEKLNFMRDTDTGSREIVRAWRVALFSSAALTECKGFVFLYFVSVYVSGHGRNKYWNAQLPYGYAVR